MSTASCWGEGVSSDAARRGAIKNHRVVINRRSPCLVCAYGGGGEDGRGNLRENREDPAPTVGIAIRIAPKYRPLP